MNNTKKIFSSDDNSMYFNIFFKQFLKTFGSIDGALHLKRILKIETCIAGKKRCGSGKFNSLWQ